jgi:hypothetical protein
MDKTSYAFGFPFEMYSDLMIKFHIEVVRAQRWDLTTDSRLDTVYCLN